METSSTSKPAAPDKAFHRSFGRRLLNVPEIGALGAVIVFFVIFYIANKSMGDASSFTRIVNEGTFIGLASLGMSFLMIAGEIDLSAGSIAGLAAVVAGMLLANAGWPEWSSYLAAILAALVAGGINAFVVLKIGMPSFFATLASSFSIAGLLIWLLNGNFIYQEGRIPLLEKLALTGPIEGLPWGFVIYVALVIIGDVIMRTTKLGPILSAVGGNRRAAEIVGINVKAVKAACFIFVALVCGFAGLLVTGYGKTTDPGIGSGWLLWVIAIAIIGGGSLRGGVGSIIGGLLGTLLIEVIRVGLTAAQVKTNAQGIVVGAILIGAAALDAYRRRAIQY
ncbi:MAG: ABC transporter permease [Chloroflexi bacterium]|nr:ABC transporter permease [Chloroflexota bacterium]